MKCPSAEFFSILRFRFGSTSAVECHHHQLYGQTLLLAITLIIRTTERCASIMLNTFSVSNSFHVRKRSFEALQDRYPFLAAFYLGLAPSGWKLDRFEMLPRFRFAFFLYVCLLCSQISKLLVMICSPVYCHCLILVSFVYTSITGSLSFLA